MYKTGASASGGLYMNLLNYANDLIYASGNTKIFRTFSTVSGSCYRNILPAQKRKSPGPAGIVKTFSALLWNLHDGDTLSATLLPREKPFTFEGHYTPTTRTQMHSHEYLELFYIIDGEYRQKILDSEFTFSKGELCLIDRNCLHQEILDGTSATILFLGITPDIFDDITKNSTGAEGMAGFLNTALLKQKNVQQYLHFRLRSDADPLMEETFLALLAELSRNDAASPLICKGLLMRLFGLLAPTMNFRCQKKVKKEMTGFFWRKSQHL